MYTDLYRSLDEDKKTVLHGMCGTYLSLVRNASSLTELMDIHLRLWKDDIRCSVMTPSGHGIFRDVSMSSLTGDDIILGREGRSLAAWESLRAGGLADPGSYAEAVSEYRHVLETGIRQVRSLFFDGGIDREAVYESFAAYARSMGMDVANVSIGSRSLEKGALHEISFDVNGMRHSCNLLKLNRDGVTDWFIPQRWYSGANAERTKDVGKFLWCSLSDGSLYNIRPALASRLGLDEDMNRASRIKI